MVVGMGTGLCLATHWESVVGKAMESTETVHCLESESRHAKVFEGTVVAAALTRSYTLALLAAHTAMTGFCQQHDGFLARLGSVVSSGLAVVSLAQRWRHPH